MTETFESNGGWRNVAAAVVLAIVLAFVGAGCGSTQTFEQQYGDGDFRYSGFSVDD